MNINDSEIVVFMSLFRSELDEDSWGDIDPNWFIKPNEEDEDDEHQEAFDSLKKAFVNTFKKFNQT